MVNLGTTEGSQGSKVEAPPGSRGAGARQGPLWGSSCPEDRTWLHIHFGSIWGGFVLIFYVYVVKYPFYKIYHFNKFFKKFIYLAVSGLSCGAWASL